ncbi:MAG: DUF86 domain-containing protein [Proteobacteria bacterium]|nr:DUF86 domain-containing protein [Pseudomonadota bacterium]
MRNEDAVRLHHMMDAGTEALRFMNGRTREDLDHDRQLEWALIKAIEIIGEAAGQVSDATKAELPNIPWRNIVGMRNRLVHAYFDVNLDILWKTVVEALPPIVAALKQILPKDT